MQKEEEGWDEGECYNIVKMWSVGTVVDGTSVISCYNCFLGKTQEVNNKYHFWPTFDKEKVETRKYDDCCGSNFGKRSDHLKTRYKFFEREKV